MGLSLDHTLSKQNLFPNNLFTDLTTSLLCRPKEIRVRCFLSFIQHEPPKPTFPAQIKVSQPFVSLLT